MIPLKEDIKKWLQEGVEKDATHMIICRDISDGHYKKVFVFKGQNPRKAYNYYNDGINYLAAEIYSFNKNLEEQLNEGLVLNFD